MDKNNDWNLVKLPYGAIIVSCKWAFKTKRYSRGKVERHKARLFVKRVHSKRRVYSKIRH
jgi:hypothetical protein